MRRVHEDERNQTLIDVVAVAVADHCVALSFLRSWKMMKEGILASPRKRMKTVRIVSFLMTWDTFPRIQEEDGLKMVTVMITEQFVAIVGKS